MTSFNIKNQIEYWKSGALSDIETAEILIDKGKFLHGLFFCHLTVEKAFKAHYVRFTKSLAPKTHDLVSLSCKVDVQVEEKYQPLIAVLMKYQLEGRYPEYKVETPSKTKARDYLNQTKELFKWLVEKL